MKHVFWRNPMFLGTSKDYYFHYIAGDLAHCFVSMHSAAIETDVCLLVKIGLNHVLFVFV